MSRFIDAENFAKLMDKLSKTDSIKEDCKKAYHAVYLMLTLEKDKYSPTAFDVDELISELEQASYDEDINPLDPFTGPPKKIVRLDIAKSIINNKCLNS